MTMLQHGLVPSTGGYQVERSLRFNSADSAYLNRTPGSAGNRKTWTWSGWVKRGKLSGSFYFFCGYSATTDAGFLGIDFEGNDRIEITGWQTVWRSTSAQYRDPSAWYHIVVALDTTQATADNRVRLYVNGSEVTAFVTKNNPSQNNDLGVNTTGVHYISSYDGTNSDFDGYMADVHFIDGQALTPSSFGENDTDTGVWKPKAYTGSYGTNGFKLTFSDNSGTTATTLGKDTSGNGNNWTPNNFSVTAGAGNDSLVDTPTPYGTDTGAGGQVRGNYCTFNPISSTSTLSNGNLDQQGSNTGCACTIPFNGFNAYSEITVTRLDNPSGNPSHIGILDISAVSAGTLATSTNADAVLYVGNGTILRNTGSGYSTVQSGLATYGVNDVIGLAYHSGNNTIQFYKNGSTVGTAVSLTSGKSYSAFIHNSGGAVVSGHTANFGQRPFAYTAPSGFKALCTTNLPTPTIGATSSTRADDYFGIATYAGTGGSGTVTTGIDMATGGGLVWFKARNGAFDHHLINNVSGYDKFLSSNKTDSENTYSFVTSATSTGLSINGGSTNVNGSGYNYVAWNWKANGTGVTNTAGTITSTVSANTTAGFSIVNWSGSTSSSSQTVGHGLGVAPQMVILKNRDLVDNWVVYHASATSTSQYLLLNTTAAVATNPGAIWGAGMTSTVVGVKPNVFCLSTSDDVIMYCFAPVAGYSAFGSYTGNGSADGPMVFTGFKPAYVMIKQSSASGEHWTILDNKRNTYNVINKELYANLSNAEGSNAGNATLDFLSNGFKIRTSNAGQNASSATYIYAAFASDPFKYSLAA